MPVVTAFSVNFRHAITEVLSIDSSKVSAGSKGQKLRTSDQACLAFPGLRFGSNDSA